MKRLSGKKHGYIFEIDATAEGPVPAIPVPQAGRRAHEAAFESAGGPTNNEAITYAIYEPFHKRAGSV